MIIEPHSHAGFAAHPARRAARFAQARQAGLAVLRGDPVPVVLLLATGLLAGWHLGWYPRTWFDEGMYLQVAKNLATEHLYAVRSPDGTLDYAPIIGVGPTVLVPAAVAVWLAGISLTAARLVAVLYTLAATLLVYRIARGLFGRAAALSTIVLLFTLPSVAWLATGRQLLGEVPAVALLLAGAAAAYRATTARRAMVAGVVLGLAMVTKGQYLLIFPATIVGAGLIDRLDSRQRPAHWYAALLGASLTTYAAWITLLLLVMGNGSFTDSVDHMREASGGALLIFNVDRMVAAARLLVGPASFFLVVPAALAGLVAIVRAPAERRWALTALWVFQALWLTWFVGASIGWPRYAFPGLVVNAIFMGAIAGRLVTAISSRVRAGAWRTGATAWLAAAGLALLLLIAGGAWRSVSPVVGADQREPQRFAELLDRVVPADATIDGWEPEIGFLSSRLLQHPPPRTLDRVVRAQWFGDPSPDLSAGLRGDYLVVGPFASWVGVYAGAVESPRYVLVAQVGEYHLFKRVAGTALGAGDREDT